ncbi:ABC transporter permease [Natranaerobius trueperi]|uniref:ABC transporter permease n=1 Tax=Natranaerobius trueperi TaxID=759412 RepID=A0A226C2B4_9FIRM|nr:ABC transporter permease [Natranaerobius trueperi]OWZ84547.1 ABC transporter permease [Natranaerobius trueperi]
MNLNNEPRKQSEIEYRTKRLKISHKLKIFIIKYFSYLKKYSFIILPVIYLLLGSGAIIYNVQNPVDSLTETWLDYSTVFESLIRHIRLVGFASVGAVLTSVPLGILITRPKFRWLTPLVDNTINIAQTVPSIAILGLFYTILGIGETTALFALWLYSLLPILRNTSIGIQGIAPDIIESARGMGMTSCRIFTKVEFPLALPVIMAGIRTTVVICTGAATLATFIGGGGLGDIISAGLNLDRYQLVYLGATLSALFALLLDNVLGTLEQALKR